MAMPAKEMHERTGQQKQIRQRAKNMRLMLFPKQHKRYSHKADKDEKGGRAPEARSLLFTVMS
jgi:hypothetical protein